MGKQDDRGKAPEPAQPFNSPFASLKLDRDALPKGPEPVPAREPVAGGPARAVVRMERKGRGGKEVTVVEQLGLAGEALDRWCKELKQSLGCGGTVEEDAIVLQGDHRERVKALLLARGVKKVAVG